MPNKVIKLFFTAVLIVICANFLGCSTFVKEPLSYNDPQLKHLDHPDAYRLLSDAQKTPYPERGAYEVEALRFLISDRLYQPAEKLLKLIPTGSLTPVVQIQRNLQAARLYTLTQRGAAAIKVLNEIKQPESLSLEDQILVHQLYADAFYLTQNYLESARMRVWLDELLKSSDEILDNRDKLWQSLLKVSPRALTEESTRERSVFSGWAALAVIQQNNAYDIPTLVTLVRAWQQDYPLHPARESLPDPLSTYMTLKIVYPTQIALLLPLQGQLKESAAALQTGFFESYYELQKSMPSKMPVIKIYDSTQGNIKNVYARAVNEGATLVVGPLTKPELEQLTQGSFAVPTLALNTLSTGARKTNLYQFGLAPEDEVIQLADKMIENGHQNPLLIVPNDDLGQRVTVAFTNRFRQQHKQPVAVIRFEPGQDVATEIHQKLQPAGNAFRYDSVALIAFAKEGRQIRPLLSYYSQNQLPVYATSHIFSGVLSEPEDSDLEGTLFCDIPLILDPSGFKNITDPALERFKRLYALGYDAFKLTPYLTEFSNDLEWHGLTGQLSADNNQVIHRRLKWAEFRGGRPVLMD